MYLYGYKQVDQSNLNYVFGKIDSIFQIWFMELSTTLDTIKFITNPLTSQLEPNLIIPDFGLTNFELIDYSQPNVRPLVLG